MKTLPSIFYVAPSSATTTMSRKDLKELLLETDGWVMSCGHAWDIKGKQIGAGVWKVLLKLQEILPSGVEPKEEK